MGKSLLSRISAQREKDQNDLGYLFSLTWGRNKWLWDQINEISRTTVLSTHAVVLMIKIRYVPDAELEDILNEVRSVCREKTDIFLTKRRSKR